MERIEVLRGPQGTLYGRNATAGAANIVTKQPHETPEANASFTAGDYDLRRVEVGASGPITDSIAGRASIVYDDHSGYRDNDVLDHDQDAADLKAGRGSLYFSLTDNVELVLRGDYAKQKSTGGLLVTLQESPTPLGISPSNIGGFLTFPDPALGGLSLADVFGLTFPQSSFPSVIIDPEDLDVINEQPNSRKIEQKGVSATLTWESDLMTTKIIAAHRDSMMEFLADSDGTDVQMLTNDALQNNDQTTVEINLSGRAFDDRMDWLVGAYYFQEDGLARFYYDLAALQTTFEAIFGLFAPGGTAPLPPGSLAFFGTRLKTGQGTPAPFLDFRIDQDSESIAGFAQGTYSVTDALRLTLGARYTQDQKEARRQLTSNLGAPPCDSESDKTWDQTTGTAILDYAFNDDTLTYLSVSKGYKAGGYNPGECTGAFKPENLISYETGVKTQVADGLLQLNGAVFFYQYDDIQVNQFVNNASRITNAAEAEILGAELEFVALLGGSGFSVDGGITWLDTEYGGGAAFSNPILGGPAIEVDGNDLMRAPEWKYYIGGQYDWETSIGRFMARVDAAYSDSFYYDVFEASLPNQSEMEQDSYTIANARLSWTSLDGRYEVMGFLQNFTDEQYAESRQAVGTTGAVIGEFSAPRTYGVRLSAHLGGD
jgi:iron complex outermembrane receptor protein